MVVQPNGYVVPDPEPDEVSAIDRYTGQISVWLAGMRDEEEQAREACALFNELAAARPGVGLVLSHGLSYVWQPRGRATGDNIRAGWGFSRGVRFFWEVAS